MLTTLQKIVLDSFKSFSNIGISDVADILIVAFLIYKIIGLIFKTGSYRIAKGVIVLLLALWISGVLRLNTINFILLSAVQLGSIILVILFQPELRRIIEKVGSSRLNTLLGRQEQPRNMEASVMQTVFACIDLAKTKTGALVIFERDTPLIDAVNSGTPIDAELTAELLKNIFFPKAPMHDGAVIIREGRVAAAGCMLPLSTNPNLSRELGMRHRAGIGMSERSDAVVIIVSEESGAISVAVDGMLKRHLEADTFEELLRNDLLEEEYKKSGLANWFSNAFR